MVCKEEVVHWFQNQESFKRIDTMCTLLNMCLPFELRFLGTVLEELGGRDSKELRGIELRVNNPNELAQEIASSQLCDPADTKARRKLALYFALIRACSRPCINELFNILYSWSNYDFLKHAKGDALQELLLVYTMASNHPVFSFEQRMRCGEIYNKILYDNTEMIYTAEMAATSTTADSCAHDEMNSASQGDLSEQIPSTSNVSQAGSQAVNISPHHVESVTHNYPSQTSNVTSSTRPNQIGQQPTPPQQTTPPPPPTTATLPPPPLQTQSMQPIPQTQATSNTTNLSYSMQNLNLVDGNNVVYVNNEGIPMMRKSDSGSASSIESIDDSTPPDTPQSIDANNSTAISSSSSFKKHRVRSDSKSSTSSSNRHKVSMGVQSQPQTHLLYGTGQMIPSIPGSVPISGDIVHQTNALSQPSTMITTPAAIPGFSIDNRNVIYQQYPPHTTPHQIPKSQMNAAYHYQAMPISNRAPILTTHTTTTAQQAAASFRLPNTTYIQPNGELIHYQFPTTIAYLPPQAMTLVSRQPSTSTQAPLHLPTITSLSSKSNLQPIVMAIEPNTKPNMSCFNCGSAAHNGQDCPEASMEDVNRGIYKLDYNTIIVNDAAKASPLELVDNGNSAVKGSSDSITHIPPSVLNK